MTERSNRNTSGVDETVPAGVSPPPGTAEPPSPISQEEMSPFHGVARHSLTYGAGIVIGRAVSFIMLPVYTQFLTPADYGVIALIEMTLDFIAIMAGGTLAAGLFRFYYKADTDRERGEVVATSFLLIATMYAFVGLGSFLAAGQLSSILFDSTENAGLFRIASINLALSGLTIVPLAFARVKDRSALFVGMNLARAGLAVTFNIIFLVQLGMGARGVFLSSLISSAIVGLAVSIWLTRHVPLGWSTGAAKNLLRFGLPLMATTIATFTATFADRFFLKAVADETAVGLYNLGYQFGFVLVLLGFTPVQLVWGPRRFKVVNAPNRDEILSRGFLLINVLIVSVAVAISLFVQDLLYVMAAPAFHPAAQVVPVILVAYILQCWAGIQDIGILVSERTQFITIADFAAAGVAVIGYYFLIPMFLGWGAAYATLAAFLTRYLLTYAFSQRLMPVRYHWRPVAVLCAWGGAIAAIGYFTPPMSPVGSIPLRGALAMVFLTGVWYLPILTDEDRYAAVRTGRSMMRIIGLPQSWGAK